MSGRSKIVVGITCGDLNGVGLEIVLKTFEDNRMFDFCTPILFASTQAVNEYRKNIHVKTTTNTISSVKKINPKGVTIFECWKENVAIELGKPTKEAGTYAAKSLEFAIKSLKNNDIDFLLTAPINKDTIQSDSFQFPGHTEFLEHHLEGKSLMILMQENLRVGLVTGHIPVSEVSKSLTQDLIKSKVDIMYQSLKQDFSISKPKIALLGLNPHAGDNGLIGKEETEIINPVVESYQASGKLVYGPYAADGFFGSETYKQFDGVLAMYHDQGLAPFKSLSFGKGVNYTAGLSHIRTSPDHGTAYNIAGKGEADTTSFKEALFSGIKLYRNRKENKELIANKLEIKSQH